RWWLIKMVICEPPECLAQLPGKLEKPVTIKLFHWPRRFGKGIFKIMKIKKGDNVMVLLGKDRGKEGKVEKILNKNGKVVVTGVNVVKRHIRRGLAGNSEGGIIDIMKPINVSNVVLICPNCKQPTRVGYQTDGDLKMRICKKCGKDIK